MEKNIVIKKELLSFTRYFLILFLILFYFLPDYTFKDAIEVSALTAMVFHIPVLIKILKQK